MSSLALTSSGLAVDAHPLAAPKGAMRVVDNAVCDLPGIIRARPSFEKGTQKTATYVPVAMAVYGTTRIAVSKDGSNYRLESEAATITGNADPVSYDAAETSFAEARKSLYYCSSTGVRALRTEAGTTTDAAGLYVFLSGSSSSFAVSAAEPGPFNGPFSVAYRMVVKRTDANGYVKRSAPSARFYVRSTGAVNLAIELGGGTSATKRILTGGSLVAGDEVEFYRTVTVASADGTPASDMYLVTSYVITATDVTNSYFPVAGTIIYDKLTDAQLGEALYTNPGREGILASKGQPPICSHLCLWQSSMWFGRTKERHRLTVVLQYAGQDSGTADRRANPTEFTLGHRSQVGTTGVAITGDLASGTNTILNVTDVTGVVVGDYVSANGDTPFLTSASFGIPSGTTVTSISGAGPYTVTMSANATATAVGAEPRFFNKIVIDGVPFAAGGSQPLGLGGDRQTFLSSTFSTNAGRAEETATYLCAAINNANAAGTITVRAYDGGDGTITLERTSANGAAFTVTSTKPMAFAPQFGSGLTSTQEDRQNRVFFSLPDEPEAVPLVNFIDIGAQNFPIQRLLPCGDSLMVFKEDGLYRINGSYGATGNPGWSVSCVDPEIRLVRPEAAAVLNNLIYAWTNRGVCEIDEGGIRGEPISNGKIGSLLASAQNSIIGSSTWHGARVLVSPRHQLVLVTVPATAVSYSTDVYCYSTLTRAWTKWPNVYIRCGDTGVDGVLWTAWNNSLNELEWETRYLLDYARGFDRSYQLGAGSGAPTAWTVTGSSTAMSITNAQRNEWVPTVGDWVMFKVAAGDVYRRIVTVVAAGGGDYSWTLDSAAPSDAATASQSWCFVGSPTLLEWLPSAAGQAGAALMVWRGLNFSVDQAATALVSPTTARITLGVKHDGAASASEIVGTPARSTVQTRPYRFGWPREAGRRTDVAVRLGWSEVYWQWRMAGVTLVGEETSEKVRR